MGLCQTKEVAILAYKQDLIREGRAGAEQQECAEMGKAPPKEGLGHFSLKDRIMCLLT